MMAHEPDALSEPCLFCGAERGERCRDTLTNRPMRHFHPSRVRAAGFAEVGEHPDEMPEDRWDAP